jgi:5-methylcytosine-specific restriction endonuclease McrA
MTNIREDVVKKLEETGSWSAGTARLGERAGYLCEYCHLDLFADVNSYKQWHVDHIVPLSCGGDPVDFDNLAISCKPCNFDFKRRWDPRKKAGNGASRDDLIKAVRTYISEQRERTEKDLGRDRQIIGYPLR